MQWEEIAHRYNLEKFPHGDFAYSEVGSMEGTTFMNVVKSTFENDANYQQDGCYSFRLE